MNGALAVKPLPRLSRLVENTIERVLALEALEELYQNLPPSRSIDHFLVQVLEALGVSCDVSHRELSHIPRDGPTIVVANHPFGAIEGIALARLLLQRRSDVRILANQLLTRIPELSELFVAVDILGEKSAASRNFRAMRQVLRHVRGGGLLLVFPAGAVSHFQLPRGRISDPAWHPSVGRLVQTTRTNVVPIYVHGANSVIFQMAGLVNPRLRTALLPRELVNKAHSRLRIRIGQPISNAQLQTFPTDTDVVQYLRMRTYMLASVTAAQASNKEAAGAQAGMQPILAPLPNHLLKAEVEALPVAQQLVATAQYRVHYARADQIPCCVQEIGRLREVTFRAAAEGTGKSLDIDRFDAYYLHLFVWDIQAQRIVGGYRLGLTDEILESRGKRGLYTQTLFRYDRHVLDRLNPAIELGRSFVRQEYQKTYAPLMLLWQGICHFLVRSPQYAIVYGPVSISNGYTPLSRKLLVDFLEANNVELTLAPHVKPRSPFRIKRPETWDELDPRWLKDIEHVSQLVAQFEPDNKGAPVLLRHYLKMGARILGFNTDDRFGNALDALIMVDMRLADPRLLTKYMGRNGASTFLAHHALDTDALRKAS